MNTQAYYNTDLVTEIARHYGGQAVVVSIDVKYSNGQRSIYVKDGTIKIKDGIESYVKRMQDAGAGELLVTSIDREGTWSGFDEMLIKQITDITDIPVIAHGGAGCIEDIGKVIKECNASAVALGSLLVYQKQGMGVLVNFPDREKLNRLLQ